jgi:hypothetical protein
MASPIYAVVQSGFAVSSAVTLFPADRRWSLFVPSASPNTIAVQFSASSGGAGDWGALYAAADQPATVTSGSTRPAWASPFVPVTPWARVSLSTNAADVASFAFYPVTAR